MSTPTIVTFHEELRVFRCSRCEEIIQVHRAIFVDPERFTRMREMAEIDHSECREYKSVRLAKAARRYRREMRKHQDLLSRRTVYA